MDDRENLRSILDIIKNEDFIPIYPVNKKKFLYNNPEEKESKNPKNVWDFIHPDDYDLYQKNLRKQPQYWYYRDNPIKYTVNSQGYRTKEFDQINWKNSIVLFGCSHVFGIGNDDKHTISYYLEELTGIPVINMGINGSSIQSALHNSLVLNNKYETPKLIIYSWTSIIRYLLYDRNWVAYNTLGSSIDYENFSLIELLRGKRVKKQFNELYNIIGCNLLYVNLIRNIWKNKSPIYEFSLFENSSDYFDCDYFSNVQDKARDLHHYGQITNKLIAEFIYNKIKDKL